MDAKKYAEQQRDLVTAWNNYSLSGDTVSARVVDKDVKEFMAAHNVKDYGEHFGSDGKRSASWRMSSPPSHRPSRPRMQAKNFIESHCEISNSHRTFHTRSASRPHALKIQNSLQDTSAGPLEAIWSKRRRSSLRNRTRLASTRTRAAERRARWSQISSPEFQKPTARRWTSTPSSTR